MGTGFTKPRLVNRRTQVSPPPLPPPLPPPPPKPRTPSPQPIKYSHIHSKRSFSPLPLIPKTNQQQFQSNNPLTHYENIWENNGKLSTTFEKLIRSGSIKIEHEQKEINSNQNTTKHQTQYNSAQVDSTLTSEVQSIHSLATSDKIDTLIINLKQTQIDFDQAVKRRIEKITTENESILAQIVEETQLNQQQLLISAKEQQIIQDEQYRILLESFIKDLDEKRAKQLAFIQEQLQEQRLQIFYQSQLKIRALNEQTNSIKTQIMSQEEQKAAQQIDSIIEQIDSISTESAIQNIATEIKTNINLTVNQSVRAEHISNKYEHNSNRQLLTRRTTFFGN